jgi:hypothetical protein
LLVKELKKVAKPSHPSEAQYLYYLLRNNMYYLLRENPSVLTFEAPAKELSSVPIGGKLYYHYLNLAK